MKKIKLIMWLFLCLGLLSLKSLKMEFPPILFEGFSTFKSPRTGFAPGYVFRVPNDDKEKQIFVCQLNATEFLLRDSFMLVNVNRQWNTSVYLGFLGIDDLKIAGKFGRNIDITTSFGRLHHEAIPEEKLDAIIKEKVNFKTNSKYYIITETLAADSIKYISTKRNKASLDLNVTADKVTIGTSDTVNGSTFANLITRFEKPYRIMYKVLEFDKDGTKLTDAKIEFYKTKVQIK